MDITSTAMMVRTWFTRDFSHAEMMLKISEINGSVAAGGTSSLFTAYAKPQNPGSKIVVDQKRPFCYNMDLQ
jgi:hypothetical protein